MFSPINASTYEMNVNMVEHQHSILAVLGVDLWIPKADVQTRTYHSGIYRDQAQVENFLAQEFIQNVTHQNTDETTAEVLKADSNPHHLKARTTPVIAEHAQESTSEHDKVVQREAIIIAPFELQACSFEHCVILIDSTHLTVEQSNLWRNIQLARSSQFSSVKWPFPLAPLQDGRGVSAYIQGFVDALAIDKKTVVLGDITPTNLNVFEKLPSLQEMLDEPLLKRQLWNLMR